MVSAEEEHAYVDFETSANDSRARINVMLEQNRAFQLYYTLHLEINYWEESDITSLSRTFLNSILISKEDSLNFGAALVHREVLDSLYFKLMQRT